jgi:hypothetical protein
MRTTTVMSGVDSSRLMTLRSVPAGVWERGEQIRRRIVVNDSCPVPRARDRGTISPLPNHVITRTRRSVRRCWLHLEYRIPIGTYPTAWYALTSLPKRFGRTNWRDPLGLSISWLTMYRVAPALLQLGQQLLVGYAWPFDVMHSVENKSGSEDREKAPSRVPMSDGSAPVLLSLNETRYTRVTDVLPRWSDLHAPSRRPGSLQRSVDNAPSLSRWRSRIPYPSARTTVDVRTISPLVWSRHEQHGSV